MPIPRPSPRSRSASGFPCPKCGYDRLAYIEGNDIVHILELRCAKCKNGWAVENSHPPGRFLNVRRYRTET